MTQVPIRVTFIRLYNSYKMHVIIESVTQVPIRVTLLSTPYSVECVRGKLYKTNTAANSKYVEPGRYTNIAFGERICEHWNLINEIGNEQHYLKQCSNSIFKEIIDVALSGS